LVAEREAGDPERVGDAGSWGGCFHRNIMSLAA
jgi:hypothetical protein